MGRLFPHSFFLESRSKKGWTGLEPKAQEPPSDFFSAISLAASEVASGLRPSELVGGSGGPLKAPFWSTHFQPFHKVQFNCALVVRASGAVLQTKQKKWRSLV
jgi:hypothetical protein